jgi:uncharacterized protein YcfJ
MKKWMFVAAMAISCGLGLAQEVGRVLSSTPIVVQVGVPRQVCTTEQVSVAQPRSGAGAVVGAIAGGALANAAAHGHGQAAATLIGIMGGAIIGDRLERPSGVSLQNIQRCSHQVVYENQTVAYNVVYRYAGKQYAVQMPRDPGKTIALQVSPVGSALSVAQSDRVTSVQSDYVQPAPVIVTQGIYSHDDRRPWYPPVAINLGYSYPSSRHSHDRWH